LSDQVPLSILIFALCPQVARASHRTAIALQPVLKVSAMLSVEGTDVALIHGIRHVNLALIDGSLALFPCAR
jgi:hypothetical protein